MAIDHLVRRLENRLYGRVRSPQATAVSDRPARPWDVRGLEGHKYCLLVSYRASGQPVSTPVWFGIDGARIVIRSGAGDGKIKRIRRTPDVLAAPCTARGHPLGDPLRGRARILDSTERQAAEEVLRSSYGLGRKLYRLVRRRIHVEYLEVTAG